MPSTCICCLQVVVYNNLPVDWPLVSEGISIHWHGFSMNGAPWYDGVGYLAQCPIKAGANFTYRFQASALIHAPFSTKRYSSSASKAASSAGSGLHAIKRVHSGGSQRLSFILCCQSLYSFVPQVNEEPGTYFWHGHAGMEKVDSFFGPLIVHPPPGAPAPAQYDEERILLLSDNYHAESAPLTFALNRCADL